MDTNPTDIWVDGRMAALESSADWTPDNAQGLVRLREGRTAQRRVRMALVLTAVGLAGALAFPATRVLAGKCVDACVAQTGRLFGFAAPIPGPERRGAPDFVLEDANGRLVKLSDLRGKLVLVNFWATWCYPCRLEIPWFVAFRRQYAEEGLVILGVSSMKTSGRRFVPPSAN